MSMSRQFFTVVQADPDRLRRLVDRRPDVDVLAPAVPPEELDGELDQLGGRARRLHEHEPAVLHEPREVLLEAKPAP